MLGVRQGATNRRQRHDNTLGCQNPNCLLPFAEGLRWRGDGEQCRCVACYIYTSNNPGSERSAEVVERGQGLARAHEEKQPCGNPNYKAPFEEGKLFHWNSNGWKCDPCYQYFKSNKVDRPLETVEIHRAHQELALQGCKTRNCMAPYEEGKRFMISITDDGPERRCQPCHEYRKKKGVERPPKLISFERARHARREAASAGTEDAV